jgi:hypothetical protein
MAMTKALGGEASWNMRAVATDAFGSALGNSIVKGMKARADADAEAKYKSDNEKYDSAFSKHYDEREKSIITQDGQRSQGVANDNANRAKGSGTAQMGKQSAVDLQKIDDNAQDDLDNLMLDGISLVVRDAINQGRNSQKARALHAQVASNRQNTQRLIQKSRAHRQFIHNNVYAKGNARAAAEFKAGNSIPGVNFDAGYNWAGAMEVAQAEVAYGKQQTEAFRRFMNRPGVAKTVGALQTLEGAFLTGLGLTLSSTGLGAVVGVPIAAIGADQMQAGLRTVYNGKYADSVLSQGLQAAGMSPMQAGLTEAALGAGLPALVSKSAKVANAARTAKATNTVADDIWLRAKEIDGVTVNRLPCFVAGTLVQTDSGLKPIDEFTGGEKVLAWNERTGEIKYQRVVDTKRFEDKEIYQLTTIDKDNNKEVFRTTENHPFWIDGTGWVKAGELAPGDALLTPDGQTARVYSLEKENCTETVYNIEVFNFHTYFIGHTNILVHNDDCGKIEIIAQEGGNHARWIVRADGTPESVSGVLKEDFGGAAAGNKRSPLEEAQALIAGRRGLSSDDGGHLIAHRFMKNQGDKNLFPQDSNLNRSSYKVLENDYMRALKQSGTEIHFSHELANFDATGRPGTIYVDTTIYRNNEIFDEIIHTFDNEPGRQYVRRY